MTSEFEFGLDDRQLEVLGKAIGEGIVGGLFQDPREPMGGVKPLALFAEVVGRAIGQELARAKHIPPRDKAAA